MIKRILSIFVFALLILACLLIALLVGDGTGKVSMIGWCGLFFIVTAVVVDVAFLLIAKASLDFNVEGFTIECARGESADMNISFRNKSPFVIQRIRGDYFLKGGMEKSILEKSLLMSIGPFASRRIDVPMDFRHIGVFEVGISNIQIGDMLGLFTAKVKGERATAVRIMPRLFDIAGVELSEDAMLESKRARKSVLADSQDYAYVRDYAMGDPLKSIHWKLSARMGSYFTRLYEMSTNPGVVVIIDFYALVDDLDEAHELLDLVLEVGLSIVVWANRQGLDVEIRYIDKSGDMVVTDRYDPALIDDIIDSLPADIRDKELQKATSELIRKMIAERSGHNNVIVCSADLSEEMVSSIEFVRADQRKPFFLAAVPDKYVDDDRIEYCKNLNALDGSGASYEAFSDTTMFEKEVIR